MFKKILTVCLLLAGIQIIEAGYFIDEYYVSYPLTLDWYAANRFCTYYGMYLIDVPHEKEYNRILGIIKMANNNITADSDKPLIWTSGVRFFDEPTYYWETTGQPIIFAVWYPGDPHLGVEKCLILFPPQGYKLADYTCELKCGFMCRKTLLNPMCDAYRREQNNEALQYP